MNKFIILLILFSSAGYCIEINDIYIKEENGITGFKEAIYKHAGKIFKKNNSYFIVINNIEYVFDLKSRFNQFGPVLNNIFPNHFLVAFLFVSVKPKKQIYLNNDYLSDTDDQGNAKKYLYVDKSGIYVINLKNNKNEKIESSVIDISNINKVECVGQNPMECKVFNKNY